MAAKRIIWRGEYPVRRDEVDRQGILTLPALASYLQDAAAHHARELGFSVKDLSVQGLTWVLSRLHLRIERQPFWGERLRVETWPAGLQRLFALRDYQVFAADGQLAASAAGDWLLMHLESRRPARPPVSFRRLVKENHPRVLQGSDVGLEADFEASGERRLEVRPSDLDINRHVNHVRYLEWMLDSLEDAVWRPREFEIEFRGEAFLGQTLQTRWAQGEGGRVLHSLRRESDGRLLAVARSGL